MIVQSLQLIPRHSNAPSSVNSGAQYSFSIGTSDWSFSGSSPCPGGVSDCYTLQSVSVSVDNGASISSSHTWGGSEGRALTVTQTVSNRLGPVSLSYAVVVRRYQEQTLQRQVNYNAHYECHYTDGDGNGQYGRHPDCGCCESVCCTTENYQGRVDIGTTSMTASASLLLLPTGVSVLTQPTSTYTAATTTAVSVTLQLAPAVTVISGHPFTAEMSSASESGIASCETRL